MRPIEFRKADFENYYIPTTDIAKTRNVRFFNKIIPKHIPPKTFTKVIKTSNHKKELQRKVCFIPKILQNLTKLIPIK